MNRKYNDEKWRIYDDINRSIRITKISINRLESCNLKNIPKFVNDINSLIEWLNNNINNNIELNDLKEIEILLNKYEV